MKLRDAGECCALDRGQARSHRVSPLNTKPCGSWLASDALKITTLAIAIGLGGCAGLPDQRLANEALKRGDTALAERNYRQLADLGYSDAQARLGRLLVATPGASEAEHIEAETLLSKAFANGESNTLVPLAMLYLQYPHSFPGVNAQQRIDQWRAAGYPEADLAQMLLYRTQGTFDQHLDEVERICKAALSTTDICYVELATVYQKRGQADRQAEMVKQLQDAYQRGAVPATRVDSVARVLADAKLGKTDEKTAQTLLEQVAAANPASWVSLAQLLYDFPELGDVDKLMAYIDKGRAADQPRAELLLGRLYYDGKMVPADAKQAESHLQNAAATENNAHYYLGLLYGRGYLGQVEPQKALDHLLTAARGGQSNADYALARLFSQGHGTRPDPVNAYVFSQLALAQNTPQATELAQQLNEQLPPAQRAQAQRLLQQERRMRALQADGEDSL